MGKELPCHKDLPVKCRCNVISRKVVCWQMSKCIFVYKLVWMAHTWYKKIWGFQCSILVHLNVSITSTISVEIHKLFACLTLISWAVPRENAEFLEANNHSKLFSANGIIALS